MVEQLRRAAVAFAAIVVLGTNNVLAQPAHPLDNLTLPDAVLDGSCTLADARSVTTTDHRRRMMRWAGSELPNPWRGDDAAVVATIREGIVPAPRMPDGPPLSRAEQARFHLRLADDIEQAYIAWYLNEGDRLVSVEALTFKERIPDLGERPPSPLFRTGRTVIVVRGTAGRCGQLVLRFVEQQVAAASLKRHYRGNIR